jgi:hypothetical protein
MQEPFCPENCAECIEISNRIGGDTGIVSCLDLEQDFESNCWGFDMNNPKHTNGHKKCGGHEKEDVYGWGTVKEPDFDTQLLLSKKKDKK